MNGYAVVTRPEGFSENSGLWPVVKELGLTPLEFHRTWQRVQRKSWTAGSWLREWGNRWYGSGWNSLVPWVDERRFLKALPKGASGFPVHFLWGEFAAPKRADAYREKGAKVVVSVHCSARRWESVWRRPDGYAGADLVVLTSESQRAFVERDVPRERVRRILHGVVSRYFMPGPREVRGKKLRMFLFGNTERDHEFAAKVAKLLPEDRFEWRVRTVSHEKSHYEGAGCVELLPRLTDEEVREEYRQADLLCMPMLDSAANNVFLESMACGTPVMTNRKGGVPEYLDEGCNVVMPQEADAEAWVEKLAELERNREILEGMRAPVRRWAEGFDWTKMADEYRAAYQGLSLG